MIERLSKKELEKVTGGTIFWSQGDNALQKYFVRGREFDTRQSAITASMNLGEPPVFIEVGTVFWQEVCQLQKTLADYLTRRYPKVLLKYFIERQALRLKKGVALWWSYDSVVLA